MCVIAVSAVGINPPTEQNLKDMFEYNDDGAGISYVLDNRVYTYKGLMTWSDFEKTYALLEKKLKTAGKTFKDIAVMYHFRIGTHGPNSEGLTHPFPISHDFKHLSALELASDVVMAHNGIISSVTPRSGWSDTQQYISDIVLPLMQEDRFFYKKKHFKNLLSNTINGSRLAFLNNNSEFTFIGDWTESDLPELKGIKYSNLNHETMWRYPSYNFKSIANEYGYKDVYGYSLPVGTKLYSEKDMDKHFQPAPDAKFMLVQEPDKYYVDEYGELYTKSPQTKLLYPVYTVDYAFDKENELIYSTRPDVEPLGHTITAYGYIV